jgi:hypothetical protein
LSCDAVFIAGLDRYRQEFQFFHHCNNQSERAPLLQVGAVVSAVTSHRLTWW